MGRIVALDVGRKRTGIAVTDSLQLIANGLETLPTAQIPDFLVNYTQQETVDLVVVGAPVTMSNQPSEAERYIEPLLNRIVKLLPTLRIVRHDERFTSQIALQAMIAGGVPKEKRRDKGLVDKVSAAIILQSYLDAQEWQKKQR